MKQLKAMAAAFAMMLGALGATTAAQAANISVRVNAQRDTTGLHFTPVSAEVGEFGLTPEAPDHAAGDRWRVVARDARGQVLHQVTVRGHLQRNIEVFNPATGAIDHAQSVREPQSMFEVSMPFDARVASIGVEAVRPASSGQGQVAALGEAGGSARFERRALEQLMEQSRMVAPAAMAGVTATTIIDNGAASSHMDYVFIGDGYTAAEMDKWHADAKKVIDGFMADPLFAANRAKMNVRRVDVASSQSGVDEPDRGIYRNTAMDAAFYCYSIDRLLCVNTTKVFNIVGSVLAPDARDVVIVVANSTRYGGSGGQVATLSMNTSAIEIALHEIGHTAFALADEYDYGTCSLSGEPREGDVSMNGTRSVKWGSFISSATPVPTQPGQYANGTVGVFRGAQYCTSGKYRPTENSRMRTLGYPWHAVNESLVKSVFARYTGTSDSGYTQSGTLYAGQTVTVPTASPGYIQGGSGTYSFKLTGPSGADFDLYLYKWNGSYWQVVAQSTSSMPNEMLSYNGSAGYYYAAVKADSGSGTYTVQYNYPKP